MAVAVIDPGSTGGAVGGDAEVCNNLTDPVWLLVRAARLLWEHPGPAGGDRAVFVPVIEATAGVLSAVRRAAELWGEPFPASAGQTITALRLWSGALAGAAMRASMDAGDQRMP